MPCSYIKWAARAIQDNRDAHDQGPGEDSLLTKPGSLISEARSMLTQKHIHFTEIAKLHGMPAQDENLRNVEYHEELESI